MSRPTSDDVAELEQRLRLTGYPVHVDEQGCCHGVPGLEKPRATASATRSTIHIDGPWLLVQDLGTAAVEPSTVAWVQKRPGTYAIVGVRDPFEPDVAIGAALVKHVGRG